MAGPPVLEAVSPVKAVAPASALETPEKRTGGGQPEAAELAIKRTRFRAQSPQQVFLEQLGEFEAIPASEWNAKMLDGVPRARRVGGAGGHLLRGQDGGSMG